ncbi:MAG TPA: glycoside hydrolase family 3 C-terminal domain-containing protein [Bryobacteraceae bacterium]|nr:glycoside hydrolase family 3 C-terminal domain-containing protein [Bryobacteraceae bacterium]
MIHSKVVKVLVCSAVIVIAGAQQPAAKKSLGPWMDASLSPDRRADLVIAQMTLDEKLSLVHGVGMPGVNMPTDAASAAALTRSNGGAGMIPGIPRLGIPDVNMADSAVGVARGAMRGRYSTALPSALAAASTWDPQLAYRYGALIGRELRAQGYNMSLGGGVNLMREPRNGRNFEYNGEDPILAGTMDGRLVKGIQDQGVIGDLKHYALNDQETGRHVANVKLDRRSMRETDLLAFEIALKISNAGAVMCSYNRVGGDYACENSYLLNDVLKKSWGFRGFVVSDWFATNSTAKAALAGLDQEEPFGQHFGDALRKAIESGEVPLSRLDDMAHRILRTEFATGVIDHPPVPQVVDVFGGLEEAQHVAEQGTVLLKNANGVLPLNAARVRSIAVIGSHADVAVLSGGGSAQVDPPGGNAVKEPPRPVANPTNEGEAIFGRGAVWDPSSPLKAIQAKAPAAQVKYNDGSSPTAAAALAKSSDVAIVFVNQPASEGRDLSLTLPDDQDRLVSAVAMANPRTIVVLETGGPVTMPWIDNVSAALEAWFPGIRGGEAIANILFGDVNPSGKLPATFARSEKDLPHPELPGPPKEKADFSQTAGGSFQMPRVPPFDIDYSEGLEAGYKWFDAKDKLPLFPFGHGLSYTTFSFSALHATPASVTFTVKNTGARAGSAVAEVYAGLPKDTKEPPKRLVAWQKVELAAGESKTLTLPIDPQYLSIFDVDADGWRLAPGEYTFYVGGSSRDVPLSAKVTIEGSK